MPTRKTAAHATPGARERLLSATIAVVAEKDYTGTRVSDIVRAANVSRNTFYRHFDTKDDCVAAAIDAAVDVAAARVLAAYRQRRGSCAVRLGSALDVLIELVVSQPAAAKLCCVDVHAAGPRAVERSMRLDRLLGEMVADAGGDPSKRPPASPDVVRAIIGGIRQVIHTRVARGREHELLRLGPDLREWALGYAAPFAEGGLSDDLQPATEAAAIERDRVRIDGRDARERMLVAVAELCASKGYAAMTITDIADHGRASLTSFYNNFSSKEEALLAAASYGEELLIAETLPVYQSAPSWPLAVRDGSYAFLGFLAANPALARLGLIDVYSGSSAALQWREASVTRFRALMMPGYEDHPRTPKIAAEAVGAAIAGLLYESVSTRQTERLLEMAPLVTFIALAPFLGSRKATTIAAVSEAAG